MAAAKRKRGGAGARPRKRAKAAPNGTGPPAKAGPQGAEREEHSIPAPVSKVRREADPAPARGLCLPPRDYLHSPACLRRSLCGAGVRGWGSLGCVLLLGVGALGWSLFLAIPAAGAEALAFSVGWGDVKDISSQGKSPTGWRLSFSSLRSFWQTLPPLRKVARCSL